MTARSVVLSVLLGAHPAWATAGELIFLTRDFGIRESTIRVALTRMVSAGDLVRSEDGYRLSDRLLERQRRQDDAINPRRHSWDGTWTTLVITSIGDEARARAALRNTLQNKRFAELREGVWMRPDNVGVELGDEVTERVRVLRASDDAPVELAARLWDLAGWARAGRDMLTAMAEAGDVPGRFAAAASMVRHLLTDPVLPDELLPDGWPGGALRVAYEDFATELVGRRAGVKLAEVP
ncbi:MAG: PaaX domain-containing protein, C- domain protein [Actinomycetia bacterium]|nr:PaaX domain-containing protein, C- domain protein [Actinomycetes bacterium]